MKNLAIAEEFQQLRKVPIFSAWPEPLLLELEPKMAIYPIQNSRFAQCVSFGVGFAKPTVKQERVRLPR